ncbi:hypothetical protein ACFL27_24660, partial [candidate division CSSED10-310 bacterium]
ALQYQTPFLKIKYVKGLRENDQKLFEKWNAYSRVAVFPFTKTKDNQFFEWGLDSMLVQDPPPQLFMNIDAGAATPITKFTNDLKPLEILRYGLPSLAYNLRTAPQTLIIGPGGGNDVLRALIFGSESIDAVEYNPLIYQAVNQVFGDFSGHIYDHPKVHFHLSEGRHFVQRTNRTYDIIQASLVDTFAASSAGALTLSESTLYTVEAFTDYLDHLKPAGILTISRFIHDPPWETLRIASIAREAFRRRGISDFSRHIIIYKLSKFSTTLIKKEAFTEAEIKEIMKIAQILSFSPVWVPGHKQDTAIFRSLLLDHDVEKFYRDYSLDVTPTTDDSPFFFFVGKLKNLLQKSSFRHQNIFHYQAIYILVVLLVIAWILILAFILLPLLIRGRELAITFSVIKKPLLYFLGIGVGYMTIEVGIIQRFLLPLGHPIYALSVVLFTMLVFSALGSACSFRFGQQRKYQWILFALIVTLLVPIILLHGTINDLLIGQTLWSRILLTVVILAPLSFLMGMPFPRGIRLFFSRNPSLIPWAWAINGASSVLASIGALFVAMISNYSVVLWLGAGFYCLAMLAVSGIFRQDLRPSGQENE